MIQNCGHREQCQQRTRSRSYHLSMVLQTNLHTFTGLCLVFLTTLRIIIFKRRSYMCPEAMENTLITSRLSPSADGTVPVGSKRSALSMSMRLLTCRDKNGPSKLSRTTVAIVPLSGLAIRTDRFWPSALLTYSEISNTSEWRPGANCTFHTFGLALSWKYP